MNNPEANRPSQDGCEHEIRDRAAHWLARQESGLTPAEQDEFLAWLRRDPRHRVAWQKQTATWTLLDSLALLEANPSAEPDPDFLAPPQRSWGFMHRWQALAAALVVAALGIGAVILSPYHWKASLADLDRAERAPGIRVLPAATSQLLADGSRLFPNPGVEFEVDFSATARRVVLHRGIFHVEVAKDPHRPFVVDTGTARIRAVGTAFQVRRDDRTVGLLVTEGLVQFEIDSTSDAKPVQIIPVPVGNRAEFDLRRPRLVPVVVPVAPHEIERELAVRASRLEFEAVPLAAAIHEFNLRNETQFALGDDQVGQIRVAGTFRADNMDGFARILELSFGVRIDRQASGTWFLFQAH